MFYGTSAGYQWKIGSLYPLFINKMRCRFPLAPTDMSPNTLCPQMKMILEIFLYACLKNGHIMPWPCPSVHPNFPDIFSTCFEISIWNHVYTFSKWHDMLSFSFITIGSFWLTLQLNVSRTHFFNFKSWPHKSRQILQIWYIGGPLYTSRHKFGLFVCLFQILFDYFCAFWIRSFPFFSTYFEISIWNLVCTFGRWSKRSRSSFISIGTLWPTLQLKIGQIIFLHSWPQKLYRAVRFCTHIYIVNVLTPTDCCHGWAVFGPPALGRVSLAGLPACEKFSRLFCTYFKMSIWNLIYTSSEQRHTSS